MAVGNIFEPDRELDPGRRPCGFIALARPHLVDPFWTARVQRRNWLERRLNRRCNIGKATRR